MGNRGSYKQVDIRVARAVVAECGDSFVTKDVSQDERMLASHASLCLHSHYHAFVGRALSEHRNELGVEELRKGDGTRLGLGEDPRLARHESIRRLTPSGATLGHVGSGTAVRGGRAVHGADAAAPELVPGERPARPLRLGAKAEQHGPLRQHAHA